MFEVIKRMIAMLLAAMMCLCAAGAYAEEDEDMVVGIIAAMESEIAAIKDAEQIESTYSVAGLDFCVGKIGDVDVVTVQCGEGKVNAALATQILIDRFGVNELINIGCAGSLNDTLDIGDFVVSSEVVQHDFDVTALGYEMGEISSLGTVAFKADESLIAYACDAIAAVAPERTVVTGRVCTGDLFVSTAEQKQTIIDNFAGDCAEMEGAAVGQVASLNDVPFVVIRAMSDKADSAADFTQYVDEVTREGAEVVVKMVELMEGK